MSGSDRSMPPAMTVAATLWAPSRDRIAASNLTRFAAYASEHGSLEPGADYAALHRWSITAPEEFWSAVWDFMKVSASRRGAQVLEHGDRLPGAHWFPDARLNFAENLLRSRTERPALVSRLEDGSRRVFSYAELYQHVAQLADAMRDDGIVPGDRVAGLLPNVAETVMAMLATSSIGATWTSCSPDFGVSGVLDRFGQIEPKLLFAADGYYYNGKSIDCRGRVAAVASGLDSLHRVVVVPLLGLEPQAAGSRATTSFQAYLHGGARETEFAQLPFDHPLYVMYSSGTTGAPKCIVHGAGGALLQHLKEHRLHVDLKAGDVLFYYTTCGWMMWNWLVSGLATGATLVLYDGSPFAHEGRVLLDLIDDEQINVFGVSAKYLSALEKAGHRPAESHDLSTLNTILSTGSPLAHEGFEYVYRDFKEDVCLSSISGGTDILACFVGGVPTRPVYAGEIQGVSLGMAVEFWNEAGPVPVGEKGELVCTQAFPSCPLGFWNDPDGARFHDAYFARFPGVWAHGDFGELTPHDGVIIHGRADAVLNPGGVRIGTAEIYRQVERVDEVLDSVVIGQAWDGDMRIVLFVVLRPEIELDDALRKRIADTVRQQTTARHVPAKIIQVPDIPRTISGKIVELAVREVVHGRPVKNLDALSNPEALDHFRNLPDLQV
jgi:acetoacetyl-CoA synthetase